MSALAILEQELADTLEWARRKRRQPMATRPLVRALVGDKPSRQPRHGRCCYCGTSTPWRTVCDAHQDLIDLDPAMCPVVTRTTNGERSTPIPGSCARQTGAE